jgi:hypothetical protein
MHSYDRELDIGWCCLGSKLVNILNPCVVFIDVVRRQADDFDTSLSKVWRTTSDFTEFGGADRGEIICEDS